ncbi:efflux transporter, RND family, MFP subunit [uncultured Candidatus Thioglobus sp.]|nr:efflux transporter, RND family, MFP subunit [uncultured Candidatus Thioglobus sp.]
MKISVTKSLAGCVLLSLFTQTSIAASIAQYVAVKSSYVGSFTSLGGTVIPHREVNLVAKMPGDIVFIAGEEGDKFKKGNDLARQDIDALLAKRDQASAQIASAEAGVRNAQMQLYNERVNPNSQSNAMLAGMPSIIGMFSDPMRSMTGEGDSSFQKRTNIFAMNTQLETAKNTHTQALAGLRELDENISNATIIAPFDGVILRKMVEVGQLTQPGVPMFLYGDTKKLQIRAEVPSRLARTLKKGMKLNARLDQSNDFTVITVSRIFPMADVMGHTITVKFKLPESAPASPGMYVEIMIPESTNNSIKTLTIPASAIIVRGSLPTVYVQKNGLLKMRFVRVGDVADNGWSSILSGVYPGEMVLRNPTSAITIRK